MIAILKLGGSILSDKNIPFSVKWDNLERFGEEIRNAMEHYKEKGEKLNLIIVHGGGSFGHPVAKKYLKDGKFCNMQKGFWEIQKAMRRFNNLVIDTLHFYDIPAVSIQPSSFVVFKKSGNLIFDLSAIRELLKRDLVPVVHGDIVVDEDGNYKILSGDHILPYLTKKLDVDLSLHASDVDGVLDENGNVIEKIDKSNIDDVLKMLKDSKGIDVTGGMYLKVMEAYKMGVKTVIFNGNKKGNIYNALIGDVMGTVIIGD